MNENDSAGVLVIIRDKIEKALGLVLNDFLEGFPREHRAATAPLLKMLMWDAATRRLMEAGDPQAVAALLRERADQLAASAAGPAS